MNPPEFVEQYRAVAPALRAWAEIKARGTLGAALQSDDLVQETCLAALKSLETFDAARGGFRAWLFGIATNVAAQHLRRNLRRERVAGDPRGETDPCEIPAEVTTLTRRVRHDEALSEFSRRTSELPREEQDLILYRGIEHLPHSEIAALFGWTHDQTQKRWQRLRDQLRSWPCLQSWLSD